jgi:DNA-binding IclR family transcriptional regulator
MVRNGTQSIGAVDRTLDFLERIIADRGAHSVLHLSAVAGLPPATAHRQVKTLVARGYLAPIAKGRHVAGPRLVQLGSAVGPLATLRDAARPALHRLAEAAQGAAHLGVLEDDMVTYLVKAGKAGDRLFTEEGKQLEAYCSGIGKVLLAYLPDADRERYLADGPFTALTAHTITDPARLRADLALARARGFAVDDQEIALGVRCVAVPLFWPDGTVRAAISLTHMEILTRPADILKQATMLRAVAAKLASAVLGPVNPQ